MGKDVWQRMEASSYSGHPMAKSSSHSTISHNSPSKSNPLDPEFDVKSKVSNVRLRPKKRRQRDRIDSCLDLPSRDQVIQFVGILVVAVLAGTSFSRAMKWSSNYFKPFCDTYAPSQHLSDSCLPCPENGICKEGSLQCHVGFKRSGRYCTEDTEIEKKSLKLAKWFEEFACGSYAQSFCNGAGKHWLHDKDFRTELEKQHLELLLNINAAELALVEEKAMERIRRVFERETLFNGSEKFKCPDVLAARYKSCGCRLREWIRVHYIAFLTATVVKRRFIKRAEQLYQQVCEVLEEKATMERLKGDKGEPWVISSLIRDYLLLPTERKNMALWKQIEQFIREDTRIDQYPKLIRGETRNVLEWQVEGSLHPRKRFNKAHHSMSSLNNRDQVEGLQHESKVVNSQSS
eukprot:TRINITY_DN11656_c0_g1_i2.p1 TRINITY_DN11656_c0_g1~~TRINITY_DN11656_c0_g1_i2.p1  ORF type:complete len:405 (-),score=83.85 TRINITY_DN11656_c0_g1_i2:68-1282(-)